MRCGPAASYCASWVWKIAVLPLFPMTFVDVEKIADVFWRGINLPPSMNVAIPKLVFVSIDPHRGARSDARIGSTCLQEHGFLIELLIKRLLLRARHVPSEIDQQSESEENRSREEKAHHVDMDVATPARAQADSAQQNPVLSPRSACFRYAELCAPELWLELLCTGRSKVDQREVEAFVQPSSRVPNSDRGPVCGAAGCANHKGAWVRQGSTTRSHRAT
jgi:hypothetical protein